MVTILNQRRKEKWRVSQSSRTGVKGRKGAPALSSGSGAQGKKRFAIFSNYEMRCDVGGMSDMKKQRD